MKSKKSALLLSFTSLLLCFAMLAGSTFAWFTDTATTGVNKIVAGNLKVDIVDAKDQTSLTGTGSKLLWTQKVVGTTEEPVLEAVKNEGLPLWEPGVNFLTQGFKIANKGNLALKWKVEVNKGTTTTNAKNADLLKVIDFYVVTESENGDKKATELAAFEGQLKDGNSFSTETYYIKGHMQEEAGNDYQGLELDGITITVYATQDTVENDSFDNKYDENAQYPDVAYTAVSAPTAEDVNAGNNPLAHALISASVETGVTGETKQEIVADLAAGTFKLTDKEGTVRNAVKGMEVTLNGAGADKTTYEVKKPDATGEATADYSFDGAKAVVFKNMTIEFEANTNYQGFVRAGAARFENCTIKGMGANWGVGDVVFDNCNFVFPEGGNEWTYNLWTYGGSSFTFNNCTFTSDIGKFINVYRQGNNGVVDVTLNNCKFISKAASANKAAVKINGDHAWNVTINGCMTEGKFPTANGGLWQIENAVAGNQITVGGVLAYSK